MERVNFFVSMLTPPFFSFLDWTMPLMLEHLKPDAVTPPCPVFISVSFNKPSYNLAPWRCYLLKTLLPK